LEDNIRAIKRLMERGLEILFLTNNSTRSRSSYADILAGLGIGVGPREVITSGYLAAEWLLQREGRVGVYVIGEEGLVEEMLLAGHRVLTISDSHRARAVVVGLDRGLNYLKLRAAARALLKGSLFIATNTDHMLPVEDGLDPGAGSIVAALEAATGRKVDFIAGKPNPWVVDHVARMYGISREEILVVGDRVDTDMKLAIDAGVRGLLVLTGYTKEEDLRGLEGAGAGNIYIAKTLMDLAANC